jgi:hypothetical protein
MNKTQFTKVGGVTLLVFAIGGQVGQHSSTDELPVNQETPFVSPELANAVRVVDADLHTHQEPPSSVDEPIGHDATDAVVSAVSEPFPFITDGKYRRRAPQDSRSYYYSYQGKSKYHSPCGFFN